MLHLESFKWVLEVEVEEEMVLECQEVEGEKALEESLDRTNQLTESRQQLSEE